MATYAKLLSALGVGVALTESQHLGLLVGCVVLSLGLGLREVRTTHRWEPLAVTTLGCAMLVASHVAGESPWLTWTGVGLLFVGGIWGHRIRLRRRRAPLGNAGASRASHASNGIVGLGAERVS